MKIKGFHFILLSALSGILVLTLLPCPSNQIPLNFSPHSLEPSAKVTIQGKELTCLFDLGCGPALIFKENCINNLTKEELGKTILADLKGCYYPTDIFRIQDIKIGNMEFHNLEIFKDCDAFHFNAQFGPTCELVKKRNAQKRIDRFDGKIGRKAFLSYDFFIDFPNLTLTLLEKGSGKQWCKQNKFIAVPFILDALGVSIQVTIDSKPYQMLLDTGANYSIINKTFAEQIPLKEVSPGDGDYYFPSSNLFLRDCSYGCWEFGLCEISDDWTIDGCLGADFFLEYAVYLDFQHQIAYIQRPEKYFLSTQWKRMKHRLIRFYRQKIVAI